MGVIIQSLDAQIQIYRSSYSNMIGRKEFQLSTHFAELMHATLPPRARLSDFVPFNLKRGFNYTDKIDLLAFDYCKQWMPHIETALAMYRDDILLSDR